MTQTTTHPSVVKLNQRGAAQQRGQPGLEQRGRAPHVFVEQADMALSEGGALSDVASCMCRQAGVLDRQQWCDWCSVWWGRSTSHAPSLSGLSAAAPKRDVINSAGHAEHWLRASTLSKQCV